MLEERPPGGPILQVLREAPVVSAGTPTPLPPALPKARRKPSWCCCCCLGLVLVLLLTMKSVTLPVILVLGIETAIGIVIPPSVPTAGIDALLWQPPIDQRA